MKRTPDPCTGIARSPLALGLAALFALPLAPAVAGDGGQTLVVTSCADDGSDGTLRSALALAGPNDTVDLTELQCSRITLEQGALSNYAGTIRLEGPGRDRLTIDGNHGDRVFDVSGPVTFVGLAITGGHVEADIASGGCILAFGGVALIDTDVTDCSVHGIRAASGGAIETQYFVTMVSSTVSGNSAISDGANATGGGIAVYYGGFRAETSSVSDNAAGTGGQSRGGGFFADRGTYLIRSTVDGNTADLGGGFYRDDGPFDDGQSRINDSTISGNVAAVSGGGGFVHRQNKLEIFGSTIASNTAVAGDCGGILFVSDGAGGDPSRVVDLRSSIIANNSAPASALAPDIDAPPGDPAEAIGANNLLTSIGSLVPDSYLTDDPMLAPLAANGGPTRTRALLAGSPAIDQGADVTGLGVDQRGRARVAGLAADIGAFEAQPDAMFLDGFDGID